MEVGGDQVNVVNIVGFEVFHEGTKVGDGIDGAAIVNDAVIWNVGGYKNRLNVFDGITAGNPDFEVGMILGELGGELFPAQVAPQGQDGLGFGIFVVGDRFFEKDGADHEQQEKTAHSGEKAVTFVISAVK